MKVVCNESVTLVYIKGRKVTVIDTITKSNRLEISINSIDIIVQVCFESTEKKKFSDARQERVEQKGRMGDQIRHKAIEIAYLKMGELKHRLPLRFF